MTNTNGKQEAVPEFQAEISTYQELIDNIEKGVYEAELVLIPKKLPDGHVFDEDLTVKQNRQMLEDYNHNRQAQLDVRKQNENRAHRHFEFDLRLVLVTDYALNQPQAEKIVAVAYEEGHSEGYAAVAQTAREIAELYRELWKLQKAK